MLKAHMKLPYWQPILIVMAWQLFVHPLVFAEPPIPGTVIRSILKTQFKPSDATTLLEILRDTAKSAEQLPVQAPPPETVQRAFRDPPDYITILSSFSAHQPTDDLTDPARILELLIQRFTNEFPQETEFCAFEHQPLPETLEELMLQIESHALLSRAYYSGTMDENLLLMLRRDWDTAFATILKSPYGGDLEPGELLEVKRFMVQSSEIKLDSVLCASLVWGQLIRQEWLDRLHQLMEQHPDSSAPTIIRKMTPLGEIILTGSASTAIQSHNLLLAADLGGDDTYTIESPPEFTGIPQLIIDFAGNDLYQTAHSGGFAAGVGRAAFLIDLQGNDQYKAKSQSLGTGILGVGILIDLEGNDQYFSESMTQGMALFGIGLLFDQSGDDRYLVETLAQGLGMTSGYGQLIDSSGQDDYRSNSSLPTSYGTPGIYDSWVQGVGLGLRGISAGGVGILIDLAGADTYDAMSFAQGGGYHYGLGLLLDLGDANDKYLGARYNFGWGAHAGLGYFKELGGDDEYFTRQIVAAGLAWDHSLAFFHDLAGNDIYELGEFSLGATAHHSIATFLDSGGLDVYHNAHPAISEKDPPNLSVFMDLGNESDVFDLLDAVPGCSKRDPFGFVLLLLSPFELPLDECRL